MTTNISGQRPQETDDGYARRVAEHLEAESLAQSEQARQKREEAILDREAQPPAAPRKGASREQT